MRDVVDSIVLQMVFRDPTATAVLLTNVGLLIGGAIGFALGRASKTGPS